MLCPLACTVSEAPFAQPVQLHPAVPGDRRVHRVLALAQPDVAGNRNVCRVRPDIGARRRPISLVLVP